MRRLGVAGLASLVVYVAGCSATGQSPGTQAARHFTCQVQKTVGYDCLVYLPTDYGAPGKRWPLVLYLHGAGERGRDLELLKRNGPPKMIAEGRQFPFVLVAPQCEKGSWWDPEALDALLDKVIGLYSIDDDRVYLTGLSMGGWGTWDLAIHHPERFAAIIPICGAGAQPYAAAKRLRNVPAWAFHGAKDQLVPMELSQMTVDRVKKAGGDARLTIYPDAGHDAWTETYNNPEVWDWLMSQKRRSTTAPAY